MRAPFRPGGTFFGGFLVVFGFAGLTTVLCADRRRIMGYGWWRAVDTCEERAGYEKLVFDGILCFLLAVRGNGRFLLIFG